MSAEPAGRPTVVLVVDDSPETVSFLTTVLEDLGQVVLVALNGTKAIEIARRAAPDIILMDAVMPGMDGFEACRRIKEDEASAHIPVIFMTGLNEAEHVVRAFAVGGSDYVAKPIVVEEMLARMRVRQASAEATEAAHRALDTEGKFLLCVDREGRVLWTTPQAQKLLDETWGETDGGERLGQALLLLRHAGRGKAVALDGLYFTFLGPPSSGARLLRVSVRSPEPDEVSVQVRKHYSLTDREYEILIWLTRGKSNRDMADILELSPRTIDKHLETIFRKLGVENRTAAAALAMSKRSFS